MRYGISDEGMCRIAQIFQQTGMSIQDASPRGESEVYYFSDGTTLAYTSNAWIDPYEGQVWLVLAYNPDGTRNMEPEPYLDYLQRNYNSNTIERRTELSQEDTMWLERFKEDIVEVKAEVEKQRREQHEQEGEALDVPGNVRF